MLSGGYIITFANGGGAGSWATIAEAHAMYPDRVLAEPVYDGEVSQVGGSWYKVTWYTGSTECCYASVQEATSGRPGLLLRAPQ